MATIEQSTTPPPEPDPTQPPTLDQVLEMYGEARALADHALDIGRITEEEATPVVAYEVRAARLALDTIALLLQDIREPASTETSPATPPAQATRHIPRGKNLFGLGIKETADALGISIATVRRWANEGIIESHRTPGGHRRFYPDEIREMIEDPTKQPDQIPS